MSYAIKRVYLFNFTDKIVSAWHEYFVWGNWTLSCMKYIQINLIWQDKAMSILSTEIVIFNCFILVLLLMRDFWNHQIRKSSYTHLLLFSIAQTRAAVHTTNTMINRSHACHTVLACRIRKRSDEWRWFVGTGNVKPANRRQQTLYPLKQIIAPFSDQQTERQFWRQ